jgi:hypothetical protein
VSLIVTGLVLASGVILGRLIAAGIPRRKKKDGEDAKKEEAKNEEPKPEGDGDGAKAKEKDDDGDAAKAKAKGKKEGSVPKQDKPEVDLDAFPCKLGDVVLREGGEEAWLAGVLVLSEEEPLRAMFFAPEAKKDVVVLATPRPESTLTWLRPIDADPILTRGEPPTSIEHEGHRFERFRRLPLRVQRSGAGTPDVGASVVIAEYRAAGPERLVTLTGSGGARAYRGFTLEEGMYEILPSGRATLE